MSDLEISVGKFLDLCKVYRFFRYQTEAHGSFWPRHGVPKDALSLPAVIDYLFAGRNTDLTRYRFFAKTILNQQGVPCGAQLFIDENLGNLYGDSAPSGRFIAGYWISDIEHFH